MKVKWKIIIIILVIVLAIAGCNLPATQPTENKNEIVMIRRFSYDMELLYNKWSPFVISSVLIIHHILQYLLPVDLTWI